jgi:hypothetical protein
VAVATAAASFAGSAFADDPLGLHPGRALSAANVVIASCCSGPAGPTVRGGRQWNASLFVRSLSGTPREDDGLPTRASSTVGAQFNLNVTRDTRIAFDVFNIFNHRAGEIDYFLAARAWSPGARDDFLSNPAEARGFRIRLRHAF